MIPTNRFGVSLGVWMLVPLSALAHDWNRHSGHSHSSHDHSHSGHDHSEHDHHSAPSSSDVKLAIKKINTQARYFLTGTTLVSTTNDKPEIARHFEKFKNVKVRWDGNTLFVESNGLPDHNMMVGIKSWQQQVPLPQPFTGDNAWQIPLKPKLADKPVSTRNNLYRGAIALAVNGVPIFNALNNRGVDAFLAGELDEWGGHCGRGDDYHYHIAPLHFSMNRMVQREQKRTSGSLVEMIGAAKDLHRLHHVENALHQGDD